jgi:hypothetical protein
MTKFHINLTRLAAIALIATSWTVPGLAQEPLPSWNDTAPRKAIVTFVERVTKQGSPDFVQPAERIATFDNDGTLWAEQPLYFQLLFAIDRVKALPAPGRPEGCPGGRRARDPRDRDGHPCRYDERRVPEDRQGLARHR